MFHVIRVRAEKDHNVYVAVDDRGRVIEFVATKEQVRKALHALDQKKRAS